jgi:hypothetical protein
MNWMETSFIVPPNFLIHSDCWGDGEKEQEGSWDYGLFGILLCGLYVKSEITKSSRMMLVELRKLWRR